MRILIRSSRVISERLVVLLLLALPVVAHAAANLMVTPSRVVFEDNVRTAQVTLINSGDTAGDFRISFIRQAMTEDGQFSPLDDSAEGMFSDPLLRYSPRQISLQPGQSQVVRIMLRKPRDLEQGEYRSHLLFQSIPKPTSSAVEATVAPPKEGITVEIIPVIGISIPVIVRHGKLESQLTLERPHIIPADKAHPSPQIAVDMVRSGSSSVYGDFRAIYLRENGEKPLVIALANGIAVYTPNSVRHYSMPLSIPEGVSLDKGKIRILFLESGKDEQQGLIAEALLPL